MGSSPDGALTIRRAEPADHAGYAWVFEGASAQSETLQLPFPSREGWRKRLEDQPPGAHLLVALVDGKIVGNTGLFPAQLNNARRAHAAHFGITVHDDYQGRGVGKALMAAILDLADRWTPYTRIELTVFNDNARAIALYKRFGFVEEGVQKQYALRNGAYADVLAMARLRRK